MSINIINKKLNILIIKLKNLNKSKFFLFLFSLIIIFALVVDPKKYMEVALNGILVWATNILPSLFPFMIFTKLLTSTGYVESASKIFNKPMKKYYNCPGISSYIFLMSILSGYPLGAKITADLYENGSINRTQAHRITTFTSNSGPMFIVGTVGVGMLISPFAGYIIYISHVFASLINGLLFKKYNTIEIIKDNLNLKKTINSKDISENMMNGINSILLIGGYITIFFIITEVLFSLGLFIPFIKLLEFLNIDGDLTQGFITGIFEITKGCLLISNSSVSLAVKTSLCCMIISFGGLAISFQAFAFLNKFKISKKFYYLQKISHSIISLMISLILCSLFFN